MLFRSEAKVAPSFPERGVAMQFAAVSLHLLSKNADSIAPE
jgi:hypothetical protein